MSIFRNICLGALASLAALVAANAPAAAQQPKPNILFIMGDDIGWMQPGIYHRGLMVGETPNIDRIGNEGAMFTHYYAEQSCTAGRTAFLTGMQPVRVGMVLPEIPGSPSYRGPGRRRAVPADLGTTRRAPEPPGTTPLLPTAHGFQNSGATSITSMDAGVSFPTSTDPGEADPAPPAPTR
jgi:arylsulfatase